MKKFIVTDPCYLLPWEIWHEACKEFNETPDMYERFDIRVQNELREFAGTELAWAGSTGIGDWTNSIESSNKNIANVIYSGFCADAGMVCICELTETIEKVVNNSLTYGTAVAMFEVDDNSKVEGIIDKSDEEWTIVKVKCNGTEVIRSEDYDERTDEDYFCEEDEYE